MRERERKRERERERDRDGRLGGDRFLPLSAYGMVGLGVVVICLSPQKPVGLVVVSLSLSV